MELRNHLEQIWLTEKQAEVFVLLYKFGTKPASSVGKMIWQERTNTYKILQSMVRKGIIAETRKQWVKHFFVADKNILRHLIEKQKDEIGENEKILPIIETELAKFDKESLSPMPQMRFFEWKSGIDNLFEDLYTFAKSKSYLVIKMFASNTLETQSTSPQNLNTYAQEFFDKTQKEWVNIEAYLGNGIMMLENLFKTYDTKEIQTLPAGSSAINVFIVWEMVYVIIYKNIPFWLKIESEEFANVLHFLLKQSVK